MGIVFPDLAGPYYSAVLLGAEAASVAAGSSLLILATHGRPQAADLARELSSRVDGLVVMGRTVDDETVRALAGRVPLVLLAREPVDDIPTVRSESREPARRLTEHLIGVHGHRRLAFVGDPGSSSDAEDRWQGFQDAHRALEVPVPPALRGPRSTSAGAAKARARRSTTSSRPRSCAPRTRSRIGAYQALDRAGPVPRPRHCCNRVRRHPARAVRHTRTDHRPPADGPAGPDRRRAAAAARRRRARRVADAAERAGDPRELRL